MVTKTESGSSVSSTRRVLEYTSGALILAVIVGVITLRDDVRDGMTFDTQAAIIHTTHDDKLDLLMAPEKVLQLAQAADAVEEAEAAAERSVANAAAIQLIQLDLSHTTDKLASIQAAQADAASTSREILRRLPQPTSP